MHVGPYIHKHFEIENNGFIVHRLQMVYTKLCIIYIYTSVVCSLMLTESPPKREYTYPRLGRGIA